MRVWFSIKSILLSGIDTSCASGGILSGGGSLNLSRALPLSFSLNFGLLQIRLSKLRFFLSNCLIFFFVFGALLDLGSGGGSGGKTHLAPKFWVVVKEEGR